MPEYNYRCVDKSGKRVNGRVEAGSRQLAVVVLRQKGLVPTAVDEFRPPAAPTASPFGSVKIGRLATYTRQFAQLSKTDIPLSEIFGILSAEEEGMLLCEASAHVAKQVAKGRMLADAMQERPRVFSKLYIKMIDAGLRSGTLDMVAQNLARMYEAESALRTKFTSKMVYPVVLLGFAFLVSMLLSALGWIPKPFVMAIIGVWIILLSLVAFGMTRLGYGIYREIGFRLPWIGSTMRKINLARFCRIFGLQYASGIPLLEGLETARDVMQDTQLEGAITRVIEYLNDGMELKEAMIMAGVFPRQVISMIGVGERAGGVEFMLEKLAEYYELDADAQADRMSTAAYFVVYLAVAITVGIVVISFWAGYWRMIGTLIDST
jgi:type IV pilus assembly protein PilC